MGVVIEFRPRAEGEGSDDIDLLTAVDVAIRDLRDIAHHLRDDSARRQAEECRAMLERAFWAASA